MAKERDISDAMTSIEFPRAGINVSEPFDLQPPGTTVDAVNVRAFEPVTLRARGGSRPGLERYLGRLATNGVIQSLDMIVDPQAEALTADDEFDQLPNVDYIDDPSTNNLRTRNPGRRVRRGGSGRQPNINIGKQRVVITWDNPADITEGTALSGTQLNATAASTLGAPVSGSFSYTPPSGTVLSVGNNQPLSVLFTPTDTGLYTTATKTVRINVTEAPSSLTWISESVATHLFSASVTRATNVQVGDLVIAFVGCAGGSGGLTFTVDDDQANPYTQIEADMELEDGFGNIISFSAWWAIATSSGTLTVTGTASQVASPAISVTVIRGAHPTAPIRNSVSNSALEQNMPFTATTTDIGGASGDLLIANFQITDTLGSSVNFDAGSGFTAGSTAGSGFTERKDVAAGGTEPATADTQPSTGTASYQAIGIAVQPPPP